MLSESITETVNDLPLETFKWPEGYQWSQILPLLLVCKSSVKTFFRKYWLIQTIPFPRNIPNLTELVSDEQDLRILEGKKKATHREAIHNNL